MVLENFNYEFNSGNAYALLGGNGSGKSTLLQMLAGFLTPGKGKIQYYIQDRELEEAERFHHVSICAPYLELIEEFTLKEFFAYHFSFKKKHLNTDDLLKYIGLYHARDKFIGHFSSGMKQRVKLAQAIFADTDLLLLDEPCTNLDEAGVQLYYKMLNEFTKSRLVIIASNDEQEYRYCNERISISDYKPLQTWS